MPSRSDGGDVNRQSARAAGASEAALGSARIGEEECKLYISKAAACEDVNHQAVAEAKELIASGQLDTPEAVQKVAERIASIGI